MSATHEEGHGLAIGNAAKRYCLRIIADAARDRETVRVLDLGCGDGRGVAGLLRLYPHIEYVGIEPDRQAARRAGEALSRPGVTILEGSDDVLPATAYGSFDFVISFSVLEHVRQRSTYIATCAKAMGPEGQILINYDAGHFVTGAWKDRIKTAVSPALRLARIDRHYQGFVKRAEFAAAVEAAGLAVVEEKWFNAYTLKRLSAALARDVFDDVWLAAELHFNDIGLPDDDSLTRYFGTRNYILARS